MDIVTLNQILCGALDDIKNLKAVTKIMIQIIAIIIAIIGLFTYAGSWNIMYVSFLFIFMLGYINAFNLIDGIDGLASGLALFIASGLLVISLLTNNTLTIWTSSIVIGATLGFLIFNFNPAKIFLGDSGSMLLGFILAFSAAKIWLDSDSILVLLPLLLILGIPIFDTMCAILRRLINKKPIFIGDRSHLYDLLLQNGFSVTQTVLICYTIGMILSGIGVGFYIMVMF